MTFPTLTDGSLLMDGTEQTIEDINLLQYSGVWTFFDVLSGSDAVVLRVYVPDSTGGSLVPYIAETYYSGESAPAVLVNQIPTDRFKVTLQQTSGSFKTIKYRLVGP